jgi:hypothetical protein
LGALGTSGRISNPGRMGRGDLRTGRMGLHSSDRRGRSAEQLPEPIGVADLLQQRSRLFLADDVSDHASRSGVARDRAGRVALLVSRARLGGPCDLLGPILRARAGCGAGPISVIGLRWCASKAICSVRREIIVRLVPRTLFRLVPRTLFLMPTLSIITGTTGWFLAKDLGFLDMPWPQFGWVAAALALVVLMTIQGTGYLLPKNLWVCIRSRPCQDQPGNGQLLFCGCRAGNDAGLDHRHYGAFRGRLVRPVQRRWPLAAAQR